MVEIRDRITTSSFVKYLKSLGIEVHLNTKARGNSGFCTNKRIDISKNLPAEKIIEVLFHEFAHYVHFQIEPDIAMKHGDLKKIFCCEDIKAIESELEDITLLVFNSVHIKKIDELKEKINEKIKQEREIIKEYYPDFQVCKKFREFDKFIRHSNAKYLLKYDRVLIKGGWFSKDTTISVKTLKNDFPTMPEEYIAYIKMKSYERHRNRLNARKSRIVRYLKHPTELFARFFQLYCTDIESVKQIAPLTLKRFLELKRQSYYPYLNEPPFEELP